MSYRSESTLDLVEEYAKTALTFGAASFGVGIAIFIVFVIMYSVTPLFAILGLILFIIGVSIGIYLEYESRQ